MDSKRFAILASGNGTNATALIEHWQKSKENYSIDLVVTDSPDALVIKRTEELGVKCILVPFNRSSFPTYKEAKKDYEDRLLKVLKDHQVNWLLLAGYMRIMGERILNEFHDAKLNLNRVVNVHPSLLPSFKGKDGFKEAFDYGVKVSGITIHFVDNELDTGPILLQKPFERKNTDSLESFKARGQTVEHEIFPLALDLIVKDKIKCREEYERKYIVT